MPTALYGACVAGVDDRILYNLRRIAASASGMSAQGCDLDAALLITDLHATAEATAEATAPPIVRLAEEAWYTAVRHSHGTWKTSLGPMVLCGLGPHRRRIRQNFVPMQLPCNSLKPQYTYSTNQPLRRALDGHRPRA